MDESGRLRPAAFLFCILWADWMAISLAPRNAREYPACGARLA
jgi:hypothetical protein